MAGHDQHASCEHDVAWCRHCDVIYCQGCEMIWAKPCQKFHGINMQYALPGAQYYGTASQTHLHGGGVTSSS